MFVKNDFEQDSIEYSSRESPKLEKRSIKIRSQADYCIYLFGNCGEESLRDFFLRWAKGKNAVRISTVFYVSLSIGNGFWRPVW